MKFKSQFTTLPTPGRTFTEPSKTVPNQSLSIREMQERYARGQSVPVQLMTEQEVVDGDFELTKVITDLTDIDERQQRLDELQQKLADIKAKMKEPKEPTKQEEPSEAKEGETT